MAASSSAGERAMALRALLSLAFAAWIGGQFATGGTSRTTAALTYVVILVVSVIAHEVAHAVVGRTVGAQVTGMRLGFGPRLTPAGSWLDLRPLIVAAHVSYVPPRGARRGQLVAICAAGLVLHLLLALIALVVGTGQVWARELLLANLLAFVSNALPTQGGGVTSTSAGPNDGMQLAGLLRSRGSFLSPADPDLHDAARAYDEGGVAAATAHLDALARPDVPYLRLVLAQAVLSAGRWDHAATLAAGGAEPGRPWLADHLTAEAGAMAMLTGAGPTHPDAVAVAAAHAEAAWAAIPASAPAPQRFAVAHTVALVRLLEGRYDEAAALTDVPGAGRAPVLAVQGWAELGLDHRERAEGLLNEAMRVDCDDPLVRAFAQRLTGTPAVP